MNEQNDAVGTPPQFIADLLEEYAGLVARHSEVLTDRMPASVEVSRIKKSIDRCLHRRRNLLVAAQEWYHGIPGDLPELTRLHHLDCLLHRVDAYFSERRVLMATVSQGSLTLGMKWWHMREHVLFGSGPLTRPQFDVYCPFPHLRMGAPRGADKWIDAGDTFEPVSQEGKLRIGLCALSSACRTRFTATKALDKPETGEWVLGFRATHVEYVTGGAGTPAVAEPDHQELRECVSWAREEGVHVLCFPELCICEKSRQALADEISSDPGSLCLVVPGSHHDPLGDAPGQWVNAAPIWVLRQGERTEVGRYEKAQAFQVRVGEARRLEALGALCQAADEEGCTWLEEHIVPRGSLRCVNTPVGVFGVLICKDALIPEQIMAEYAPLADHLLIVSMNPSPEGGFLDKARDIARTYACATFYVNTTQFVPSSDAATEIVLWRIPGRHMPRSQRDTCFYRSANEGKVTGPTDPTKPRRDVLPAHGRTSVAVDVPPELREW